MSMNCEDDGWKKSLSGLVDFGLHFVVMFESFRFVSICKTRYRNFFIILLIILRPYFIIGRIFFLPIFFAGVYIYICSKLLFIYFEYTHTSLVCNVCHTNLNPRLTALNINIAKYMPLQ